MLRNYILILWRSIIRHPLYTILNLLGLGIGIAAALYILLYIHFELHFDAHHTQADRIFRVETTKIHTKDRIMDVNWQGVPGNLGPIIKKDYPEVKAMVRHYPFFRSEPVFEYGDKRFEAQNVYNVDATALDIFTFDILHGNPKDALTGPNKIILSSSLAERIFGDQNPVGKVLSSNTPTTTTLDEDLNLVVTAVYRDMPDNAHWVPEAMISAETDPALPDFYFNRFSFRTYLLLEEGVDAQAFSEKLSDIYIRYLDPVREPVMKKAEHRLVPLLEIHFDETEGQAYLYIFGSIGILLLLIAMISYVNLAIAQTSKRAKEVGLRKVLGSNRFHLMMQFLGESIFISLLSLGVGLILLDTGSSFINAWLSLNLDMSQLKEPELFASTLTLVIFTGLLGGSYPAFFLSSFQAVDVLKGRVSQSGQSYTIRKVLVGIQFVAVMFVLISTGMIYLQLQYVRSKDLGFDQAQMVALTLPDQEENEALAQLKAGLGSSPHVLGFAQSAFLPGIGSMVRGPLSVETPAGPQQRFTYRSRVDTDFLELMDIQIVEGRGFKSGYAKDSMQGAIINQTFAREFELDEAVGTRIRLGHQDNPNFLEVIGVIEDFHESSLHLPIQAQLFRLGRNNLFTLIVKIDQDVTGGLQQIRETWEQRFPQTPFTYTFLDEELREVYEEDRLRGKIFVAFSLITLFIAFLGLFGLSSFLTEQRVKEIGIRKVLGANTSDLLILVAKPFLILLSLAAIPAFFAAWLFLGNWLENFAFQIDMNYGIFALVLFFVLVLTIATTSFHAVRVSRRDPIDALRDE